MNLIPWKHTKNIDIHRSDDLLSFQRDVNRLFEDFFGDLTFPSFEQHVQAIAPAIDIIENDKAFKITAEFPAMEPDDVEVNINNHYLTISGEKREEKEERDKGDIIVRRERYYGQYKRTLALPDTADIDNAEEAFERGLLTIEIPKKSELQTTSRKAKVKKAG